MSRSHRHRAEQELSDAALIRAARRRLLGELGGGQPSAAQHVINNVYGGGGLMDRLGAVPPGGGEAGGGGADDPYDYFVDINRRNVTDPESGDVVGWDKNVHRYRHEKKKAP